MSSILRNLFRKQQVECQLDEEVCAYVDMVRQAMIHIGAPGARASALGLVLGFILCAGALRAMHSVLYGVGVYDVPTILTVVLVLVSVTIMATIVPTMRGCGNRSGKDPAG